MPENVLLAQFKKNYFSQHGEDGIILEILNRLGVFSESGEQWCVEFGAGDGIQLSNTCYLIRNHQFRSVLIEGSKKRYAELCRNIPSTSAIKINQYVEVKGDNSLENILSRTQIPTDFDFLSIDIDGADYHIWAGLTHYRPKLVCIEYNMNIPIEVDFKQPPSTRINWGSSAKALDQLAKAKGYTTVAVTYSNILCVRNDLLGKLGDIVIPPIEEMFSHQDKVFLFSGYDGTILSNKKAVDLTWHGIQAPISKLQYLPKFLIRYRDDYNKLQKRFFKLFRSHINRKNQGE